MTGYVESTIDELKPWVTSETYVNILSTRTLHIEGNETYQLLYYTGAFDDYHAFNGVSYEPITEAAIRHRIKELLMYF